MIIRIIITISVFAFLLISCKEEQKSIKVTKGPITESVYASGFIKSKNQYNVNAPVNGIISEVYVKEGDLVEKGKALFKINNSTIDLNIEQARINKELNDYNANVFKIQELESSIESAKLKMLNDSVFLERQKKLWEQQIGSKAELDLKTLAYENSKNSVESLYIKLQDLKRQLSIAERLAKTNLKISETMATDFIVSSKIKGRVFSLLAEEGEFASIQSPMAIIGDSEDHIIELLIDEYDIVKLSPGQKVFLRMDSYKNEVFEAELIKIVPIMNERSKSFTAEAVFTKGPKQLYPNMTVEANILIKSKDNVLIVPRNYLTENNELVLKSGKKVKVKTGLKDYQKVEILSGITAEDEIIEPDL